MLTNICTFVNCKELIIFKIHQMRNNLLKLIVICFVLITITLTAQIPNSSFENWTKVNGVMEPTGWSVVTPIQGYPPLLHL